eukprot:2271835-Amphidinium_carterae.1
MLRVHGGQVLDGPACQQLARLQRQACRICASIRIQTNPQCGTCGCATALRKLRTLWAQNTSNKGAPLFKGSIP